MSIASLPEEGSNGKIYFHTVQINTGIEIHYAEQGDPGGRAVVFLHGYPDSWNSFSLVLRYLSPKYHAFSLDQRGFGDSSKPADGYTQQDFAADVLAFLDIQKIKKATIVGHSMGSFIAQKVALFFPDRVEKLVLIGSAPTARNNSVILELLDAVKTLKDPIGRNFVSAFQAGTAYKLLPEGFLESVISESLKAPAHVWQKVLLSLSDEDNLADLHNIAHPTLIVWGDRDALFTKQDQEVLATEIPKATLKVYKEAGHSLNWENAELLTRDLEDFLGEADQ